MILSAHVLAGGAIAVRTGNPVLGIIFAFLSHYLLDAIPHAEYSVGKLRYLKQGRIKPAVVHFLRALADLSLGLAAVYFLSATAGHSPLIALAGGFAGALPDGITLILYLLPKFPLLARQHFLHESIHFHRHIPSRKDKTHSSKWILLGLSTQGIIITAALLFLSTNY